VYHTGAVSGVTHRPQRGLVLDGCMYDMWAWDSYATESFATLKTFNKILLSHGMDGTEFNKSNRSHDHKIIKEITSQQCVISQHYLRFNHFNGVKSVLIHSKK